MSRQPEKPLKSNDLRGNEPAPRKTTPEVKQRDVRLPPGRSDVALKRYENLNEKQEEHKEHSLQEHAKERAKHPHNLNAGTPFDWEDLEDYQKELERLDREGPKSSETP